MRLATVLAVLCWRALVVAAALEQWQKWGPFRPNLYFGVRPQIPKTLLAGLMWASGEDKTSMLRTIRDTCEQDDGMEGYGWTMYDTRVGGSQIIHDTKLNVDMRTEFIKSSDGEGWGVRVTGVPKIDGVKTAVIFHVALEDAEDATVKTMECHMAEPPPGSTDSRAAVVVCDGSDPVLGSFELKAYTDDKNMLVHGPAVKSLKIDEDKIWQAKSVFMDQNKDATQSTMILDGPGEGNIHFLQAVFQGQFTMDFMFSSASSKHALAPGDLTNQMDEFTSLFPSRVDKVFPRSTPFQHSQYAGFTQYLLSNLLGGLGFFYGDSKVDKTHAAEYDETDIEFWDKEADAMNDAKITTSKPTSLLSHTPSRPFFPRGFLWDEGFHLLSIIEWDLDLAVSVIQSWFSLMDEDGWIGREQILGAEARSKVPEKFQVQYPHFANPTTLSLLFPVLISKITGKSPYQGNPSKYVSSPDEATSLLKELYPLLARHYNWFRRTQVGNFSSIYPRPKGVVDGEGYRWRGRTPTHTLTSGLDDYPRANPPHPAELHVDALAWVGASAAALQQVAYYLGIKDDAMLYAKHYLNVRHNLDLLHWDQTQGAYCDATINDAGQYERVCHLGYVSHMPLFLGLLDARHPRLQATLQSLTDERKLWSPHGIRSLSLADDHYGKDEDYWRGAIWMNLNVLAVRKLHELGTAETKAVAAELRRRLVKTVYDDWTQTGFVWEQYDDKTGRGRRTRAFTGWTACVLLLMGLDLGGTEQGSGKPGFVTVVLFACLAGLVWMLRKRWMHWWRMAKQFESGHRGRRRRRRLYDEVIDLDEREADPRVY